ncbi:oxidoreductase [Microdochium trichocladiopsis]|uniref:Oxidoreductase n=1 Tax=Microdochium trichocladiopsis TaxID=1682393 RepID=A0A9P9BP16_9PEZI|nr:oxidoreductase [Microdochium trichocladiopsis]KAH7021433.1 oxidoreductase [Microdochium trichocladiopsis]
MPNLEQYVDFNPEKETPSLAGRVLFVTGGTAGLGRATVISLARHSPAHIYFTGRNASAAADLLAEIKQIDPAVGTTFLKMDMNSLADVKKACVDGFRHSRLDLVVCNAGVMYIPVGLSADGFENHFAINHLAHAMILRVLMPVLARTATDPKLDNVDVRVVSLSSDAWRIHPKDGITFSTIRTEQKSWVGGAYRYGQSKLANLVYASALSHHVPASSANHNKPNSKTKGIKFLSVHPGAVTTGLTTTKLSTLDRAAIKAYTLYARITMMDESQGRLSQLWVAAGAPRDELVDGGYYMPVGRLSQDRLDEMAKSEELRDELWRFTEEVLDGF